MCFTNVCQCSCSSVRHIWTHSQCEMAMWNDSKAAFHAHIKINSACNVEPQSGGASGVQCKTSQWAQTMTLRGSNVSRGWSTGVYWWLTGFSGRTAGYSKLFISKLCRALTVTRVAEMNSVFREHICKLLRIQQFYVDNHMSCWQKNISGGYKRIY